MLEPRGFHSERSPFRGAQRHVALVPKLSWSSQESRAIEPASTGQVSAKQTPAVSWNDWNAFRWIEVSCDSGNYLRGTTVPTDCYNGMKNRLISGNRGGCNARGIKNEELSAMSIPPRKIADTTDIFSTAGRKSADLDCSNSPRNLRPVHLKFILP